MYKSADDIKKQYSIIDIAIRLGLNIDRNNKAICPFHNDKNPSLSFNIKDNYYHCFSCGASGDNIKLVMELLKCSFNEAIIFITGNDYKSIKYNNKDYIKENKVVKVTIIEENYSDIYNRFIDLLDNEEALYYLKNRCITEKQVIENKIKNIPKDRKKQFFIINELLKHYSEENLIKSGILSKNKENNNLYLFHYRHRLIIPYFDTDIQNINSVQGRNIDNEEIKPKYLFNRNAKDSIYNIHKLSDIKDLIICEGAIDALSLERLGYCSIALAGVSKVNLLEKYDILKKYNIYSFSDNDNAGKQLIKDIYNIDNYKGSFVINSFTANNDIKDINELLIKSNIKSFKINNIEYNYFEMPNDKICILDYYIFTKNELQYIKNKKDFNKSLYLLSLDKKRLTEKEYKLKYGEIN
ncbi:DNA primase-like protein [Brachyspira suanatina]|uniref:DNA primase-like protein n=1 Tax=Brachyspira suanatina TaxID=381802 RepID=A0A0G4KB29_9SPIR|nr:CHC2 zinc finger domain-containing protein [Brachyspira suanatina]CRF35702.1 DNA primase-like protein [Brachyspira suanatina]